MENLIESSSEKLKRAWETLYEKRGDDAVIAVSLSTLKLKKLEKGYIACFNPDHDAKRMMKRLFTKTDVKKSAATSPTTTATETKHSISYPFDGSKWNYLKAKEDQIIAYYNQKTQRLVLPGDDEFNSFTKEAKEEFYIFFATAFPYSRYHTVIVPNPNLKLPQVFREDCFLEVLRIYSHFDSKKLW